MKKVKYYLHNKASKIATLFFQQHYAISTSKNKKNCIFKVLNSLELEVCNFTDLEES
jgi:hypothetical protein